jgi:GalNAc5-diNAcBac-PP-undecaprenol beta-1,3-glucosyltransferase
MADERGSQRAVAAAAVAVAATVLVPTHTHGETLRYSIPTALRQTVADIEIFVIGDAVPDVTRAIVREFADPRVRFFDFPKGPSRGELYRHQVLQEARGEIVCYLFDDDLWLPDHVAVMQQILRDADFAFTQPVVAGVDGAISAPFIDLGRPLHRRLFTNSKSGMVSEPTCAAHTRSLYRRLPHGWRTTPPGFAPDKYMWAQCLADPRTVARSGARPTAILFPDPPRRGWPLQRRLEELRTWSARLDEARAVEPQRLPDFVLRGYELALRLPFGSRALTRFVRKALAPRSAPAGE